MLFQWGFVYIAGDADADADAALYRDYDDHDNTWSSNESNRMNRIVLVFWCEKARNDSFKTTMYNLQMHILVYGFVSAFVVVLFWTFNLILVEYESKDPIKLYCYIVRAFFNNTIRSSFVFLFRFCDTRCWSRRIGFFLCSKRYRHMIL